MGAFSIWRIFAKPFLYTEKILMLDGWNCGWLIFYQKQMCKYEPDEYLSEIGKN